jgi:quercetin dioxygenase-like cupin family protein
MMMSRRTFAASSAAAVLAAHLPAHAPAFAADNALVSAFAPARRSLQATRITARGIAAVTITAETLGNSPILQFLNRKATAVAVYGAPEGHVVPPRTISVDAPEFLFVIEGELTITTDQGSVPANVGALVLLEGGTVSERAGGDGYKVIKVRLGAA